MDNVPSWLFGIFGLVTGSFLNVCIYRMPLEESVVWPGSFCPACGRFLKPIDLVPVLSWVALRGKCRTCGVKISPRYAAIEILTGIVFFWSAETAGGSVSEFICSAMFLSGLIVVFFTDLDHWIIPDKVVLPLAIVGLLLAAYNGMVQGWGVFLDAAGAGAIGFFGFLAIGTIGTVLAKKDAMGGGDIKLAGVIGLYLGLQLMLAGFFIAFLLGTLVSLPMLMFRRWSSKDPVPFGTMLAVGSVISLVKGNELIVWYGDLMARIWMY